MENIESGTSNFESQAAELVHDAFAIEFKRPMLGYRITRQPNGTWHVCNAAGQRIDPEEYPTAHAAWGSIGK